MKYLLQLVAWCTLQVFEEMIDNLEELIQSYDSTCKSGELSTHLIYKYKINHLSIILKRKLNVVAKFIQDLITSILDCKSEENIRIVFR